MVGGGRAFHRVVAERSCSPRIARTHRRTQRGARSTCDRVRAQRGNGHVVRRGAFNRISRVARATRNCNRTPYCARKSRRRQKDRGATVADLKKKIVEKVGGGSSLESSAIYARYRRKKRRPDVQAEINRLLSLEQSLEADARDATNVSDTFKRLEQEIDQAPSVDQSEFANLGAASLKIAELLEQEKQHDEARRNGSGRARSHRGAASRRRMRGAVMC